MRIALANLRYPGTAEDSVELAVDGIQQAAAARASVVCYPECFVPGYRGLGKHPSAPDAAFLQRAWFTTAQAAAAARITVILGTERIVERQLRISALVIGADGSIEGHQDKVQLDPSEEATYSAGADRRLFRVGPLTFGVVICHEGWRYPETVRWAARRGAQVVFHPHFDLAAPDRPRPPRFADPENSFHEKAMLCRAAENTCYFASVNYASEHSATTSAVIDPAGEVVAWQPYGQEGLLVADVDLTRASGLLAKRFRQP